MPKEDVILLIDNYDSFTYNLYHYIIEASKNKNGSQKVQKVLIKRNDQISIAEIKTLNPKAIILSPGPCGPNEAGICLDIIQEFKAAYPIFGVCLGHQVIAQAFGAKIIKTNPMHGKISLINHQKTSLFKGIPSPFKATRYHSLIIKKETCPKDLTITATTEDGTIMAIEHKKYQIFGVQFHPESIASEYGHEIIKDFLDRI
jgi:anthranilate synthase/aminodeoxychorismate synthase-like glutamine amidotransferase